MEQKSFSGGYQFKRFAGQPSIDLVNLAIPPQAIIPLNQGFGYDLQPLVKVGDKVKAGQVIARDDERLSSPVHASISGEVIEIEVCDVLTCHVALVKIKSDGSDKFEPVPGSRQDWEQLSQPEIEKLIYESGAASLGREGLPTRYKSALLELSSASDIIIAGVGADIFNPPVGLYLEGEFLQKFVAGIKILNKLLPQAKIHLALSEQQSAIVAAVRRTTAGLAYFDVFALKPRYPQDMIELLAPALLGKKFPLGGKAAQLGVVSLNLADIHHIYEAVVEGRPLIDRIVSLCGPGFLANKQVRARIGSPLSSVLKEHLNPSEQMRLVKNSLMTGAQLTDMWLPIDSTTQAIIAIPERAEREFLSFALPGACKSSYANVYPTCVLPLQKQLDANLHGEKRPCVQCGFCQDVCPTSLIPHLLYRLVSREVIDESLIDYHINDCIQCNLCSFVCPCKIELANFIKHGQQLLKQGEGA